MLVSIRDVSSDGCWCQLSLRLVSALSQSYRKQLEDKRQRKGALRVWLAATKHICGMSKRWALARAMSSSGET